MWMKESFGGYYTLEMTFVMTFCIWIILGILYLALFTHDYCTIYSVTENVLSEESNNGKSYEKENVEGKIQNKLKQQMMITSIERVLVADNVRAIRAKIGYSMNVKLPYVRKLVGKIRGTELEVERHVICPALDRWNSEIVKGK